MSALKTSTALLLAAALLFQAALPTLCAQTVGQAA